MRLPAVGDRSIREAFRTIEQDWKKVRTTDSNIVIGAGVALILTAPNGTQYRLVVDNAGNLGATDILDPDADNAYSSAFSSAFKVS